MSESFTINSIPQSIKGTDNLTVGLTNTQITLNGNPIGSLALTPGTGPGQISLYSEFQLNVPAGGADSIDLTTGHVTGGETFTLTTPGGAAFALTAGLKYAELALLPGSTNASSVSLSGGASNPFIFGIGGTPTITVQRGTGNPGANFRTVAGDSIGFAISGAHKNLVIMNSDTINVAKINMYLAGN